MLKNQPLKYTLYFIMYHMSIACVNKALSLPVEEVL